MALNVDQPVSEETMEKVRAVPGVISAKMILL
jgi:nitrate reductase NapAB chaperone NapD